MPDATHAAVPAGGACSTGAMPAVATMSLASYG